MSSHIATKKIYFNYLNSHKSFEKEEDIKFSETHNNPKALTYFVFKELQHKIIIVI